MSLTLQQKQEAVKQVGADLEKAQAVIVAEYGMGAVFKRAVADFAVRVVVAVIAGNDQPTFPGSVFDLNADTGACGVPAPFGFLGRLGNVNRFGPG